MVQTTDILAALSRALPPKRRQVDHEALFDALARQVPALVGAPDRWTLFVSGLEAAERDGAIVLPAKTGKGWIRYLQPNLPAWIRLPPEAARTDIFDHKAHPWCNELVFLAQEKNLKRSVRNAALEIQGFFSGGGATRPIVPIKERSYDIFGDEKKLEEIVGTATLFGPSRLTFSALRCRLVEPVPVSESFKRGHGVIVLENEATFDSFCRLSRHTEAFKVVVYGRGNEILKCVEYLRRLAASLEVREISYFGDVDRRGLGIAEELAQLLAPEVLLRPYEQGYEFILLEAEESPPAPNAPSSSAWIGQHSAGKARSVLSRNSAIPQERFGWEEICRIHKLSPELE